MQNNRILYIDFNRGTLTNTEMARVVGYPELIYGSAPMWEIHLVVSDGEGGTTGADLSDAVAWHAAVDTDFTESTTPMVRTLDPDIDHSGAASGVILVPLDTNTTTFHDKVDNRQTLPAYFELRGLDAEDKTIYCWQLRINALGAVDPEGGEPVPVASGGVTLSDVYAVVRQTPLLQYSANGTSWHDTQILSDLYARVSVRGGDWSDSILLPSGAQGPSGEPGTPGVDGQSVTGVVVSTLPDTSLATASLEDEILTLGIPSGRPGADGSIITGAVATTLSAGEQATAAYVDNTLYFGIPSGFQGPKGDPGQDGSAITGVVVSTLPDTAQASASFVDGLLSFGIPSGTPGDESIPEGVVEAVSALPEATAATVGKVYLKTDNGHTYLGASEQTETTQEVEVQSSGIKLAYTTGEYPPRIAANTAFNKAGTYTAGDGSTCDYYTAIGSDGFTYFLADYYSSSYGAKTVLLNKGTAPSSWDSRTISSFDSWSPSDGRSGGKTLETIKSITNWLNHDDQDFGAVIKFDGDYPAGSHKKITLTGFEDTTYNGTYEVTRENVEVTGIDGSKWIPVYSNGTRYIYAANHPMHPVSYCWTAGTGVGSGAYCFTSRTFGTSDDLVKDLESAWTEHWTTGAASGFYVTATATWWRNETVTVTTYSFTDITPAANVDGFNPFAPVNEGSVVQMQPGHFYRYEGTGSAASAYFTPLAGAAASKSWHCTLSFNGNACLSGGSFTIFGVDGQLWHSVSSSETWLIPSAGLYDFWWHTPSGASGQSSAYVKPIGFFTY